MNVYKEYLNRNFFISLIEGTRNLSVESFLGSTFFLLMVVVNNPYFYESMLFERKCRIQPPKSLIV